jgi:photosystem II stability/assembly factor-like uncharacterized protein
MSLVSGGFGVDVPARVATFALAVAALAASCTDGRSLSQPPPTKNLELFVAVGNKGNIFTSVDGAQWTPEVSPTDQSLASLAFGSSILIATGGNETILRSEDGRAWSLVRSGGEAYLGHVVFTGEQFIALGQRWSAGPSVFASPDGKTWQVLTAPEKYLFRAAVPNGNTLIVSAAYRSDLLTPALFRVEAGGTWTEISGPSFDAAVIAHGLLLTVDIHHVHRSPDGSTWQTTELTKGPSRLITGISSSGRSSVVVGGAGAIYSSTDGVTWVHQNAARGEHLYLNDVAHGQSTFVAVGSDGLVVTSPDGVAWMERPTPAPRPHLNAITYARWE